MYLQKAFSSWKPILAYPLRYWGIIRRNFMPESPNLQLEPCASAESSSFYLKYEIHLCIFCLSKIVSPAAISGFCTKMKIWKLTQKNLEFWYLLKIKWLENRKEQITTCNSKFFFVSLWYLYFLNTVSLKREAFKFAITELSTLTGARETLFGQYCLQLKRLPPSYCLPLESQKRPWRERHEEEVLPAGSSTNSVDQRVREQPG